MSTKFQISDKTTRILNTLKGKSKKSYIQIIFELAVKYKKTPNPLAEILPRFARKKGDRIKLRGE